MQRKGSAARIAEVERKLLLATKEAALAKEQMQEMMAEAERAEQEAQQREEELKETIEEQEEKIEEQAEAVSAPTYKLPRILECVPAFTGARNYTMHQETN